MTIDYDLPFGGFKDPGHHLDGRGLSSAIRSQKSKADPFFYL
jgi:hypothetical protein